MTAATYDSSLWHATAGDAVAPRPPLPGDLDVDVAIVGAGYTGLWTAYYLRALDPALRIAIVERNSVGFGASGRNGGWCSALFPPSSGAIARSAGVEAAVAVRRAMHESVVEVGRVADAEGFDIHYARGGTVSLARSAAQLVRARAAVEDEARWTGDLEGLRLLSGEEARGMAGATRVLGGTYTPHCAAIHPARLVRGLASCIERRGVRIYEDTTASEIGGGRIVTDRGNVRAEIVVRATEAYTATLPRQRRRVVPLYSLMIATEPLPASAWEQIGLRRRETFTDLRHLRIYGQRTADDRLAFGGRGAPYHFGSSVTPRFDNEAAVHAGLRSTLVDLFPVVADHAVTHEWGGPLAVPRDWCASVGLDRRSGLAWGGGYVGDGVGTANLAGRTLAQLISGQESELTRLPWVNHESPSWEPEPLRWLGVNGGRWLMASGDRVETRSGKPARRVRAFSRFMGH